MLIDQSASTIARSDVMKHAREGRSIPLEWAFHETGNLTTDPNEGPWGTTAPSGGYNGVGVALIVEIMATAMTGATLGFHASPLSSTAGAPPTTGQFLVGIDPHVASDGVFDRRMTDLVSAIQAQESARQQGKGRAAKRSEAREWGVAVSVAALEQIKAILA